MARQSLLIGLIILSGASLSACNRESGRDALDNDPFAARSTAKDAQFGEGFGKLQRAPPNSEPANIVTSDVPPVSMTAEPVEIN